ncbi:MAG: hypothetical protein KTR14_04375 [Vampirovibrio sp.]|nr:hypothetical protein [Vampirovibrio sp.]
MNFTSMKQLLLGNTPTTKPALQTAPAFDPALTSRFGGQNPFLSATNPQNSQLPAAYGENRPLHKPIFLGYRDGQALYGGSRLFILY